MSRLVYQIRFDLNSVQPKNSWWKRKQVNVKNSTKTPKCSGPTNMLYMYKNKNSSYMVNHVNTQRPQKSIDYVCVRPWMGVP